VEMRCFDAAKLRVYVSAFVSRTICCWPIGANHLELMHLSEAYQSGSSRASQLIRRYWGELQGEEEHDADAVIQLQGLFPVAFVSI
jgi:hypothetical protein